MQCGQMGQTNQSFLKEVKKIPLLHYICRYCDDKNTLVKQLTSIRDLKTTVSNVEDKVTQLTSTVDKHESMLQSQIAQVNNSEVGTADNENITAFIREERLRYDKRGNLCVFNLQQSSDDLRKFRELCINQLGLREHELFSDVLSAERVGNIATDSKPRPLIVRLSSVELKRNILKNAHKLKNFYDNGSTLKVFISHDLTRKQQEENKLLREMLRERKNNGEKVFIRRGRIFSSSRQSAPNSPTFARASSPPPSPPDQQVSDHRNRSPPSTITASNAASSLASPSTSTEAPSIPPASRSAQSLEPQSNISSSTVLAQPIPSSHSSPSTATGNHSPLSTAPTDPHQSTASTIHPAGISHTVSSSLTPSPPSQTLRNRAFTSTSSLSSAPITPRQSPGTPPGLPPSNQTPSASPSAPLAEVWATPPTIAAPPYPAAHQYQQVPEDGIRRSFRIASRNPPMGDQRQS